MTVRIASVSRHILKHCTQQWSCARNMTAFSCSLSINHYYSTTTMFLMCKKTVCIYYASNSCKGTSLHNTHLLPTPACAAIHTHTHLLTLGFEVYCAKTKIHVHTMAHSHYATQFNCSTTHAQTLNVSRGTHGHVVEKSVRIYMPEIAMCPNVQPSGTHCYTHYLALYVILFTDAHCFH